MWDCPWSNGRLKALSRALRDGTEAAGDVPAYSEVIPWYNDVATRVQSMISAEDWSPILGGRPYELSSRAKTIDTLTDKLRRAPDTPLPSVQDVAGVRFEAEMNLDEQDAVAKAICRLFTQPDGAIKDLRDDAHSGYRAVHVWLRLPVRVEVQVRTRMQGAWANTYEALADVIGRQIRYGEPPIDPVHLEVVDRLQEMSTREIAAYERTLTDAHRSAVMVETLYAETVGELGERTPQRLHEMIANHRTEFARQESIRREGESEMRQHFAESQRVLAGLRGGAGGAAVG